MDHGNTGIGKDRRLQGSTIYHRKYYQLYFITRVTSDGKPANDFKNVNSHAYPLFKAGHIQSVFAMQKDTSHYIKCVCLPEMKKDKSYNINITLDRFGDITQANCSCPAGTGPCGSCKHISALCYALD